jgi:hypothetical protein
MDNWWAQLLVPEAFPKKASLVVVRSEGFFS